MEECLEVRGQRGGDGEKGWRGGREAGREGAKLVLAKVSAGGIL